MISHSENCAMDVSDVCDVSESSTHQLVESNVRALENMPREDLSTVVRERVASWLESSSQSSIDCGEEIKERNFTYQLLQRIGIASKFQYPREPEMPWFERCESSYSELLGVD